MAEVPGFITQIWVALSNIVLRIMLALGPHIALLTLIVGYVVFGGYMFVHFEHQHHQNEVIRKEKQVDHTIEVVLQKMWDLAQDQSVTFEQFDSETKEEFLDFADAVYDAQLGGKAKGDQDENQTMNRWSLENALFFSTNYISSIGFGYIAPVTSGGRVFCVLYGLLGIPLTLVTVGNLAKFATSISFWCFEKYLQLWTRIRCNKTYTTAETEEMLENVEDNLQDIQLFRFPASLLFLVVLVYGMVIAAVFMSWEDDWDFVQSLYFAMISICTVGFGDIRPSVPNQWWALLLILIGVMITTMAMDILGSMYLDQIHNLGRALQENNPWDLLKAKRAMRRRQQTANLFRGFAQLMAMRPAARPTMNEKPKKKKKRKHMSIATDHRINQIMFTQNAPDPPADCQVSSTSAHTIRLAWNPPFAQKGVVHYNVTCRAKHTAAIMTDPPTEDQVLRVFGIMGTGFEITHLESCSLYEMTVMAYNDYGYSAAIRLMEYTEPELSPQHVAADRIGPNMIRLFWEMPLKRQKEIVGFMIYHHEGKATALDNWRKIEVNTPEARSYVFANLHYDTFYRLSVRGIYRDGSYTPLSRAVVIKTEKLNFNARVIGHSKSTELMEGLAKRDQTASTADTEESTPLISTRTSMVRYSLY